MKTASIGITAVVLLLTLSACSPGTSSSSAVTLADTKGSAQLMRNTITGQISPDITAAVTDVTDASEVCQSDPDGLMRLWRSTALTELKPDATDKLMAIQQTIAGSFVAKGWNSTSTKVSDTETLVTLENPNSLAVIELTATNDDDGDGTGATLYVNIAGPCVATAGPGSDELKQLGE